MTDTRPEIPTSHENIKTNIKKDEDFRIYDESTSEQRVVDHYRDMRTFHTVDFYRRMEQKYSFDNGNYRRLMTIEEAFDQLESYVVSICQSLCYKYSAVASLTPFHQFLFLHYRTPPIPTWSFQINSTCFKLLKAFAALDIQTGFS